MAMRVAVFRRVPTTLVSAKEPLLKGFHRPESIVLPENACIPATNVVVPAPNQFTHELTRPQPFFFTEPQPGKRPDGDFPAGTRVVLMRYDGGTYCRVVEEGGLYVEMEYQGLKQHGNRILIGCKTEENAF